MHVKHDTAVDFIKFPPLFFGHQGVVTLRKDLYIVIGALLLFGSIAFADPCSMTNEFGTITVDPCVSNSFNGQHSANVTVTLNRTAVSEKTLIDISSLTADINMPFKSNTLETMKIAQQDLITDEMNVITVNRVVDPIRDGAMNEGALKRGVGIEPMPLPVEEQMTQEFAVPGVDYSNTDTQNFEINYDTAWDESGKYDIVVYGPDGSELMRLDPWYNSIFMKRVQFNITSDEVGPVYFVMNSSFFNMSQVTSNTNCTDMLFSFINGTGDEQNAPYFLDVCNTAGNVVLNLNKSVNQTMQFYAYYQNTTNVTLGGNSTEMFDEFEGFDNASYNSSRMGIQGTVNYAISNSILSIWGDGSLMGLKSYDDSRVLDFKGKVNSNAMYCHTGFVKTGGGAWYYYINAIGCHQNSYGDQVFIHNNFQSSDASTYFTGSSSYRGAWNIYSIKSNHSAKTTYQINYGEKEVVKTTEVVNGNWSVNYAEAGPGSSASYPYQVDWVRLRKFMGPQTVSIGAMENYDTTPPIVNLTTPINATWINTTTVVFNYTVMENGTWITGCQIWSNVSGTWNVTLSNSTAITNNSVNSFDYNFSGDNLGTLWGVQCTDYSGNVGWSSENNTVGVDMTVPTVPVALTYYDVTPSSFTLIWNASVDNVSGIMKYAIYREGVNVGNTTDSRTNYTDTGLTSSTTYHYTVRGLDFAGTESNDSNTYTGTTLVSTGGSGGSGGGGGGEGGSGATTPTLTFNHDSIDTTTFVFQQKAETLTVTCIKSSKCSINVQPSADWIVVSNPTQTIEAGKSIDLTVRITPYQSGDLDANLVIYESGIVQKSIPVTVKAEINKGDIVSQIFGNVDLSFVKGDVVGVPNSALITLFGTIVTVGLISDKRTIPGSIVGLITLVFFLTQSSTIIATLT